MKMNSEKPSDKWERIPVDAAMTENSLKLARRDLKTAKDVFSRGDYDWAFSIAYNAMLQAGRAVMFHSGYRPKGEYKHVSVVLFIEQKHHSRFKDMIFMFNKIRKKRHTAVYEQVNLISREEAENALKVAEKFFEKIVEMLAE
jgi:uncharacterized protein (UPF0332 family)